MTGDEEMYHLLKTKMEKIKRTLIIIGMFVLDSFESVWPCFENEMLQLMMDQ